MEHIVEFIAGFDCINFECIRSSPRCKPGRCSSHGRHGLSILFVAKGDAGAVEFLLNTGLLPQRAVRSPSGMIECEWGGRAFPLHIGYHSKQPLHDGQTPKAESCEFCDGKPCYFDSTHCEATQAMYSLVNGGGSALWRFLDAYYEATFNGAGYPYPAQYPMRIRKPE